MHSPEEMELGDDSVKVTWCACENCNSVGPRVLTLVRHHHEYSVQLCSECCPLVPEDTLVSSEAEYSQTHPHLRNHISF